MIIFGIILFIGLFFCGAASAATLKTSHINTAKINNVGSSPAYYHGYQPSISGSRVVWVGYHNHCTIYYKNLAGGTGHMVQRSTQNQITPDISGWGVVWAQEISSKHFAVYYKNLATGKTLRLLRSPYNQYNPKISGSRIVWEQMIGHKKYIWWKNLATGYSGKLAPSTSSQSDPAISGTRVVWVQNSCIYTKNLQTGNIRKVKASKYHQFNPDISGTRIVWEESIPINWPNEIHTNLCIKNLANGYYGVITTLSNIQWELKIDGGRVIWAPKIGGNIKMKNLITGTISTVHSYSSYDNGIIEISGNNVLWTGNDGGPIYVKNLVNKSIKVIYPVLFLPDLKIIDVKIKNTGDDNVHGHQFDITLTLKNIGIIKAPASHVVVNAVWHVTGDENYNGQAWMGYRDHLYFPIINPGSSVTLTVHGYPIDVYPYQNLNIVLSDISSEVDPDYLILESNENNNQLDVYL